MPEAFRVLDTILKDYSLNHVFHFTAANTLRRKIIRHFYKIPTDKHERIRDELIAYCETFSRFGLTDDTAKCKLTNAADFADIERRNALNKDYVNVVTQLCLALSLFVIQRADWTDAIPKIADRWHNPTYATLLLRYLRIHAEEVLFWTMPFTDSIRFRAIEV